MHEPLGRWFYEWWAGLDPSCRYFAAFDLLVGSAAAWYFDVGGWLLWAPMFLVGVILFLFAGESK
jgi:hypothetical protein